MNTIVNHHIQAHAPDISTTNNNPQTPQSSKPTNNTKRVNILQFNIISIRKQTSELEHVLDQHKIDIATIQETKLKKVHKRPQFNNYNTTLRQD